MLSRMQAALSSVVEAVAWTDSNGCLEWCNSIFEELVGHNLEDMTASPLLEFLPLVLLGETVPLENHPVTLGLAGHRVDTMAYEFVSPSNCRLILELISQPVVLEDHRKSVVLAIRDITRRSERERTLLRQRELIELLQRVSEACNAADTLVHAVERTLQLVCLNMGFPVGHACFLHLNDTPDVWHVVADDYLPQRREIENDRVLQDRVRNLVIREKTATRQHVLSQWVATAVAIPVLCSSELIAVLEFYGDRRMLDDRASLHHLAQVGVQIAHVAERQRAEAEIRQAHAALEHRVVERTAELQAEVEERRKAERLKDELVATVSHELRTPLSSMLGFSELMIDQDFSRAEQMEFLGIIYSESTRLTQLINEFLDLQKIESGELRYHMQPVDICEMLFDTASLFRKHPATHCVIVDVENGFPLVFGDAGRLKQVLYNLMSNAVKFSPHGGEIQLRATRTNEKAEITITDQGLGIPEAMIPKLFQKFVRVDNADTRRIGGTGLGLALVREIVLAHGGDIWVESIEGNGSTFHLTLPLASNAG